MGGLHSRPHGGDYAAARRYRKNRSFASLSCNTATAMLKHCFSTPRQLSLPSGKSLTVHGCKHRHGFTPSTNRQLPFFHNALKCLVNQLLGGFFSGNMVRVLITFRTPRLSASILLVVYNMQILSASSFVYLVGRPVLRFAAGFFFAVAIARPNKKGVLIKSSVDDETTPLVFSRKSRPTYR